MLPSAFLQIYKIMQHGPGQPDLTYQSEYLAPIVLPIRHLFVNLQQRTSYASGGFQPTATTTSPTPPSSSTAP